MTTLERAVYFDPAGQAHYAWLTPEPIGWHYWRDSTWITCFALFECVEVAMDAGYCGA